ncbi:MAG: GNAT family N-acetyltransferase [Verrucomicrobia bacterium]|nr:GNAT family N-acetyltransferase [Verrucomicrobiota bacterium]
MATDAFRIRPYEPSDEAAVYAVCLQTGDAGRDATRLYTDPRALGHVFVGPYLHLEPELAFVLADAAGVCGYVLGALDSAKFYRACLERWLPPLRQQHPKPGGDPARWTPTQRLYHAYHHPEVYFPDSFKDYPSHLHIDLLPRAQGRGWGARMVGRLIDCLAARGSVGVHLGLSAANLRADRFYRKLGFIELARVGVEHPQTVYLGKPLVAPRAVAGSGLSP